MKIYIVEDDSSLAAGIKFTLEKDGYFADTFSDCAEARAGLKKELPDLLLLDWNLPDGNGLKLCKEIREWADLPILMLTARDLEIDQVMCLESGADDYIAKPFSLAVLKARIQALLRRNKRTDYTQPRLVSGSLSLAEKEMRVYKNQEELDLSMTEFRLLKYFLENKNQVLLKEQILERVWDEGGVFVEENTLSVNIRRLRTKIEENPSRPCYIKTIHGIGYLWEERDV